MTQTAPDIILVNGKSSVLPTGGGQALLDPYAAVMESYQGSGRHQTGKMMNTFGRTPHARQGSVSVRRPTAAVLGK